MRRIIIGLIVLALLLTACSETISGNSILVTREDAPDQVVVELRMINGEFDPKTIIVDYGDLVKLQFMNTDPFLFSVPEYGINEPVNGNHYIEFTADKKGVFVFECVDCDNKAEGIFRVN